MDIRVKGNQLEEIEGLYADYPYVYHHADLKDTRIPWHWHEELEFDYVAGGELKLITANNHYVFHKDQAFFINSNVLCTMENGENGRAVIDSHLFHPVFLSGHFKSRFSVKYLEPVLQNRSLEILEIRGETQRQKELLKKLRQVSFLQKEEDTEFQTRNLFSEIWLLLLEEIRDAEKNEGKKLSVRQVSQDRIQTMISYIRQNYADKISLEDIAASAAVSKRECLRCFQSCIRRTPYEYLMDLRIEASQKLLKTTQLPIIGIAVQTGFSNAAYFGKVFKRETGMTPGEYRKRFWRPSGI